MENKNLKEETLNKDYLTKCTSQPKDLESALKKIANLHIALNKKVEKNKNQALEITKLLEQKKKTNELFINQSHCVLDMTAMFEHQKAKSLEAIKENNRLYNYLMEQVKEIEDLKDKLNEANRTVKIGIDNSAELVSSFDKLNDTIDLLANRVKEKDTIISYLRSELK